jgi:DNA-binding transcriptional LysR family regulator
MRRRTCSSRKVRSGQADCAIGTFADLEEGIRRISLFENELMLLCDVKSPFRRIQRVTWKDFADSAIVTLTRESNIRTLIDDAYESAKLSLKPAFEVSRVSTVIMLAEAGLGASIANAWGFAKAFRVMSKPISGPRVKRRAALIYQRSRSLSPAADGFLALIRKHALRTLPRELRAEPTSSLGIIPMLNRLSAKLGTRRAVPRPWRRSYPASHVSTNRLRLAQSLLSLSIKPAIAVK